MPNFILKFCFQVQGELKRKWRSVCLNCHLSRARHFSNNFTSRNGSEHNMQFHRNSRAQSILQSETTMLWGAWNICRFNPPARPPGVKTVCTFYCGDASFHRSASSAWIRCLRRRWVHFLSAGFMFAALNKNLVSCLNRSFWLRLQVWVGYRVTCLNVLQMSQNVGCSEL